MAMAASSAFLMIFLFSTAVFSLQTPLLYHGFNNAGLLVYGKASIILPSSLLMLTDSSEFTIGRAFYPRAVQMFDKMSEPNVSSFSTTFVFTIVPSGLAPSGYGLAFVLAPSTSFPNADSEHYLGLFNSDNNGKSSNHIFAVEFDTVKGHDENVSSKGNHVGINTNGMKSVKDKAALYYEQEIFLDSGDPIQAWIDYDGVGKLLNVTIAPTTKGKPMRPLISSFPVDLRSVLKETMFVGFSASTGKETSFHYISGWSFAVNGQAPPLNISKLPTPPKMEDASSPSSSPSSTLITALVAAFSTVILLGIIFLFVMFKRRLDGEILEEWERDCPHRFSYSDLHKATKGFEDAQLVGSGGFGLVYKGIITGCEVAVKKVTRNSSQGMREFAAEIESLGKLRHKNLVNLQGWCKKKNNLLLIYDYIPNGCLYNLLYHPKQNFILNWEQRFNILIGITAGLLYLHEEWEQVVIHRDIKPSNVLIDADMNARLSDFGLARLYDHGQISHTTSIVGTIGYISPELARTGKASKTTDVFAYGVLLLEVASGRRPLESDQFILVDWVTDCHKRGRILDAVDPKLNEDYEIEEMETVLQLGLLCSHHKPEARSTMRQAMRYLRGEDQILAIDPSDFSGIVAHSDSGFSQFISKSKDISSSTGLISTASLNNGR